MRIKITKGGIFGQKGEIPIGTELTVKEEPAGWAGRYEVVSGGGDEGGKAPVYAVAEKGNGWFAITQNGKDATKGLRKDAVEGFDRLSDDEKTAFVAANKAD